MTTKQISISILISFPLHKIQIFSQMKFLHQIINKGNSKHTAFYFPFIKQESRKLKVGKLYNKYKRLPLTIIRKNKITIKKEKKKGERVKEGKKNLHGEGNGVSDLVVKVAKPCW